MKLNGWQRLWVLMSIIYIVPIIFLLISDWPDNKDIERVWAIKTIEVVRQPSQSRSDIRAAYSDLSNQEFVKRIHEKHKNDRFANQAFVKIDNEYKKNLSELTSEKFKTIGIWLLVWIIPIIGIYLLGVGLSWVFRGFRSN